MNWKWNWCEHQFQKELLNKQICNSRARTILLPVKLAFIAVCAVLKLNVPLRSNFGAPKFPHKGEKFFKSLPENLIIDGTLKGGAALSCKMAKYTFCNFIMKIKIKKCLFLVWWTQRYKTGSQVEKGKVSDFSLLNK